MSASDVQSGNFPDVAAVRVQYTDRTSFKEVAKTFGVMDDFKSGVARMAYQGVVSIGQLGHRIYIAPQSDWSGYNTTW